MDKDALIAEITAAFDGVSREGGVSLRESEVLDWAGPDEACAAARLLDTDKSWQDVSDNDLLEYHSSMYFLDAVGFQYYLPTFVLYALRHYSPDICFNQVLETILWQLEPNQYNQRRHYELVSLMTNSQKNAIGCFLQFVAAEADEFFGKDAVRIFRDYWNYY